VALAAERAAAGSQAAMALAVLPEPWAPADSRQAPCSVTSGPQVPATRAAPGITAAVVLEAAAAAAVQAVTAVFHSMAATAGAAPEAVAVAVVVQAPVVEVAALVAARSAFT
jgi:hypothetical protein